MDVVLARARAAASKAGALALAVPEGERTPRGVAAEVDRRARGAVAALLGSRDFAGRAFETAVLYPRGLPAARLVLVGLGKRAEIDGQRLRLAAAQAARRARELRAGSLTFAVPDIGGRDDAARRAQVCAEGAVLGHYRHDAYRSEKGPPPLRRIEIAADESALRDAAARARLAAAVATGARWAEGTCLARDLASTPGQDLTPEGLGRRAREIARATGASCQVLGVPELERLGMGALLAVGRGSVHPPRFIVLERAAGGGRRRGAARGRAVVVIGKGVTFDTGGISLKPAENMGKMKYDMSGAAAVLGLFAALGGPGADALPFRVVGLIPTAENMPGGAALKPGDVVRALDGTTIEVVNTDAEGRLILADALGYAARLKPEAVVDLATLTGAISIALGHHAAGLFTRDDALAAGLLEAGAASGERLWRLPLWDDYAAGLRSDTADLANSGGREGGAILGAKFLEHFARGLAWAHLDIASTAWTPLERPHEPRGPTGVGVRLLLEWIARRAGAPAPSARAAASSTAASRPAGRARRAARTRTARGAAGRRAARPRR
jgi:leucyl aminopeptidase